LDIDYLESIELMKNSKAKKYLILTKIDKADSINDLLVILQDYQDTGTAKLFDEIIPISSIRDKNLDRLLEIIKNDVPEDEIKYYDDDQMSEYSDEFYTAEIIREKALFNLNDEVPHQVFVQIEEFKETDKLVSIMANIIVSRESLKPIVIGSGGMMIKQIGQAARIELERYFDNKVYLELFVKVKKN
jgi:GTP-binding protein Era